MLRLLVSVLALALFPLSAHAQDAPRISDYELTESGERYLKAIRGGGIEAEMAYFDPTQPPPELKLNQPLEKPEEEAFEPLDLGEIGGGATIVLTLAILGCMLWMFFQYGGGVTLSLSREPDEQIIARNAAGEGQGLLGGRAMALEEILAIEDRRLALNALLSLVLRKAADECDMAIERSWTAREAERRLPAAWPHRASLSALIQTVELTYFGGRPADEDLFQTQLQASRRMLQGTAS